MVVGTAVAADGAKLRYSITGTGPVLLALTHSLAMDGAFWASVTSALGDAATVLTWDCRGHGRSDKPDGPYRVEQFADDLAAVFDAAGWDQAVCAGASMGGTVTLAFALNHPERVSALGLIDTTASYGPSAPADWAARAGKAEEEGLASLTGFQQTRWFSDTFRAENPAIVEACVNTFCANEIPAYAETCRMLGAADLTSRIGAVRVPTMILVGEEDYATPLPMARALQEGITGASLEVIPRARHLTPLECPGLIAERLLTLAAGASI